MEAALATISRAFTQRSAAELLPLLAPNGRVYLSLASFRIRPGFYGRSQVHVLLDRIFENHQTVRFAFRLPHREADPPHESPVIASRRALWIYQRMDRLDGESMIQFTLTCGVRVCHMLEIREAP